MWESIGKILKLGIIIAIWQALGWCFPLIVGGFVAYQAVKVVGSVVSGIKSRRYSELEVDEVTLKENRRRHKLNSKKPFFDRKNGWNEKALPIDMRVVSGQKSQKTYFRCAGIDRLVEGEVDRNGKNARFSFITTSEEKVDQISVFIRTHGMEGTTISKMEDGKYRIISDNAVDINELAKQFYQPMDFEVERKVDTVRQYRISNCSSYEEALEKVKQNPSQYLENVYTVFQDTVNGVKDHPTEPSSLLDTSMLEVGEYIINEKETSVYSKHVSVSAPDDMTEAALRSDASEEFTRVMTQQDKIEDQSTSEPVFSNALTDEKDTLRYLMNDRDYFPLYDKDSVQMKNTGTDLYLRFSSLEELRDVVEGRKSIEGTMVHLDKSDIGSCPGQYTLKVPVDASQFENLRANESVVSEFRERYGSYGITDEELNAAVLYHEVEKMKYTTARVCGELDFTNSTVNGVPYEQLAERLDESDRLGFAGTLSDKADMDKWLAEAAHIQNVDINVDVRKQEMVITSTVVSDPSSINWNYVTKVESRKLDVDELNTLMNRRELSAAEKKDILMRLHPDYFEMYRGRKGVGFDDPVGAYIRQEKPKVEKKTAQAVQSRKEEEKQKQAPRRNRSRNQVPTIS